MNDGVRQPKQGVPRADANLVSGATLAAAPPAPSRLRVFAAIIQYADFRQLWLGTMAGAIGQWMQQIALGWVALVITNSPGFVGAVTFAAGVPFLVVGPLAGSFVDQVDKRRLLVGAQGLAALLAVAIALDIYANTVEPWHLLAAAFLNGGLLALMTPTRQSLVPGLVASADLTNAVALMSAGQHLTRIGGPAIAGIVIAGWGVVPAFVLQAVMLVLASGFTLRLSLPSGSIPAKDTGGPLSGLRIIWTNPEIRLLFLMIAAIAFFAFPYLGFVNVFARDILLIGATGLGILMAASGSGAVVGALLVAAVGKSSGMGAPLVLAGMLYGLLVLGIALSPWAPLTAALMFVASVAGSVVASLNTSLVQHRVSDEVRGRVMGTYFVTSGLMPLGALPMGLIADLFGTRVAVGTGALIASALVGLLGLTSSQVRHL